MRLWNPNRWNHVEAGSLAAGAGEPIAIAPGIDCERCERADTVALRRALSLAGLAERAVTGPVERRSRPQVLESFRIGYATEGRTVVLGQPRGNEAPKFLPRAGAAAERKPRQPDSMWVEAEIAGVDGARSTVRWPVDFAVLDPDENWPTEYQVLVPAGARSLDIETLADLLENACFEPWSGPDEDSEETQRDRFGDHARETAARLLLDDAASREYVLERTASHALGRLLRSGDRIVVTGTEGRGRPHTKVALRKTQRPGSAPEERCRCCDSRLGNTGGRGRIGNAVTCTGCATAHEVRSSPAVALLWGRRAIPFCPLCAARGPAGDGDASHVDTARAQTALCRSCRAAIDEAGDEGTGAEVRRQ